MIKKITAIIIFMTLMSCGSAAKRLRVQGMFNDELSNIEAAIKRGNLTQALQDLNMLIEMDPKNSELRFLRGLAYQKHGQNERAIADYERIAIEGNNNSSSAKACFNLGMIYAFKIYDPQKSMTYFDRFITLDPQSQNAFRAAQIMLGMDNNVASSENFLAEGRNFESEGKSNDALKVYKKGLESNPTSSEMHRRIGQILIQSGNRDGARIHLLKANLFRPNSSSKDMAAGTSKVIDKASVKGGGRRGSININARPWGIVTIDGSKDKVETPVTGLDLSEGSHKIEVSYPPLNIREVKTVNVGTGSSVDCNIDFERKSALACS